MIKGCLQKDKSPHGIQTLEVVVADESAEADEMVKLVNLKTGQGMGRWRGMHDSSMNIQYLKRMPARC